MNPLQAIDTPADLRKLPATSWGCLPRACGGGWPHRAIRRRFPAGQERQVANDG